ncbi:PilZ domain-containing protein [Stutzerimonas nosocomialis]|uniref:PilZ domain-containing protein n=1 Tax=Stutzerimonas nosocomialis TaxID=1056496 RepID=A0A5R9QIM5_9GAMM|nr:PilZ domain-containing protein [Stutzerimonas nosocomialis]TLX56508.1 PilZ domain-containing protein [Stutzerimonas nosocomialis]TLX58271.1 PilZ domain-containing protein [Stutzerimonas nosocomialis]TLX65111.1 PilZ domain-containing protein [Stutzerimonas nosocomialis]
MSQGERDYSEKRDFIRMRIESKVVLVQGDQRIEALCLDLSSTGMQVEATSSLNMGDKVRVLIPSEHSELKGLDAETEVVRVQQLDDGRQSLGLAILAMD